MQETTVPSQPYYVYQTQECIVSSFKSHFSSYLWVFDLFGSRSVVLLVFTCRHTGLRSIQPALLFFM